MSKRIHLIGITAVTLYFLSVGSFLISRTDIALTIWELMTVISGPIVLFVLLELSQRLSCSNLNRRAMQVFMGGYMRINRGNSYYKHCCYQKAYKRRSGGSTLLSDWTMAIGRNGCGLSCVGLFYGFSVYLFGPSHCIS